MVQLMMDHSSLRWISSVHDLLCNRYWGFTLCVSGLRRLGRNILILVRMLVVVWLVLGWSLLGRSVVVFGVCRRYLFLFFCVVLLYSDNSTVFLNKICKYSQLSKDLITANILGYVAICQRERKCDVSAMARFHVYWHSIAYWGYPRRRCCLQESN